MNLDKLGKVNVDNYYVVPVSVLMSINRDNKNIKCRYKKYKYACVKKGIMHYRDILLNKNYQLDVSDFNRIGTSFIDLDDTMIPLNQILRLDNVEISKDILKKMVILVLEEMNKVFFTSDELKEIEKANKVLVKAKK